MTEESFWISWRERLAALRNVPPVLGIVWESAPAVVAAGLIFRLFASLLPMGLLWITKLIIDGIVRAASTHQPVQPRFWWLVAAEFGLAVLGTVLTRIIDYLDSLLADKYTRHVSIRVMKHAAGLDLGV
jgi:ATP-binding cassette subfamily B protein